MAFGNDEQLNIVIKAKDEATKTINSLSGRLKAMEPTFKKMSVLGTVAFGAITASATVAVKQAAIAEGSYNKFNTVFGEHSDDMLSFIKELRETMPTATHEIVRMSADLQDLLIPMGLTRESAAGMTKGFVDLANKLAAFNDVDPTEVLEAFKSGLAGSSEPLRRFGINALDSSLELEALNTGLLETGQKLADLDPITRSQVKAQALLTLSVSQSSDAIAGFEANNDSLLRRSQALSASLEEMKVTIGTALIPVIDAVVKKITPLVEKIAEWIETHPELAKNIVIAAAALAGLVAVVGALSLLLLAFNPIALMIVGAIAGIVAVVHALSNAIHFFGGTWSNVWSTAKEVFSNFINGHISQAEGMANVWVKAVNTIIGALNTIQVDIPDWVPKYGGKSFGVNIPKVPEVSLPRFEHGGTVNAPAGVAVPIMAHGQETIIPASRSLNGGVSIVVNINSPVVRDRSDVGNLRVQMNQVLRDLIRDNKLQAI